MRFRLVPWDQNLASVKKLSGRGTSKRVPINPFFEGNGRIFCF
jgi:hypothetical protein